MSYGVKIYDENGVDITGNLTPLFFIAAVTTASGFRDFGSKPKNKTLKFLFPSVFLFGSGATKPSVTLTDTTASWSNLVNSRIIFYWG